MKQKISILTCLLLCLACFFIGSKNTGEVILNTNTLTLNAGEYIDGVGCTISSSDTMEQNGVFASLNDLQLAKGSYTVTIDYETDTLGHTASLRACDYSYLPIMADTVTLRSGKSTVSTTIYVNDTKSNYQLNISYGGTGTLTIKSISIVENSTRLSYLLSSIFLIFCGINLLFSLHKKVKLPEQRTVFLSIIVISLLSSLPLFVNYMIEADDVVFHLNRIEGIKDGLLAGMFPVKIAPTWLYDYGYPTSVMYGDLFLYIPAFLRILGFPFMTAYSIYVFIVNFATCGVAYYCIKLVTEDYTVGIIGSLIYNLSFYRFINIYLRAAVGEYTAMLFLPLVVAGLYLILYKTEDKLLLKKGIFLSVIGFSGILQSHLISCEMIAIFVCLACCILFKRVFKKEAFLALCQVVVWFICLNIWWIVPFLDYRKEALNINHIDNPYIQTKGAFLAQLFFPSFTGTQANAYALYAPSGVHEEFPLAIGIVFTLGIVFFFYIIYAIQPAAQKKYVVFSKITMALSLLAIFMSTVYFPYDKLADFSELFHKYICVIQFPWRFLSIATLLLTFSLCSVFMIVKKNYKKEYTILLFTIAGLCTIIPYLGYVHSSLNAAIPFRVYDNEALNYCDIGGAEYLPLYSDVSSLSSDAYVCPENVSLSDIKRNYLTITMTVNNQNNVESYIELPLFYYKGYTAMDTSGNELSLLPGDNSVIRVSLPANYSGTLTVEFKEPLYWRLSEIFSLFVLAAFLIWLNYPLIQKKMQDSIKNRVTLSVKQN